MSFKGLDSMGEKLGKWSNPHGTEDWDEWQNSSSDFSLTEDRVANQELFLSKPQEQKQAEYVSSLASLDNFLFDTAFPLLQSCHEDIIRADAINHDVAELTGPRKITACTSLGLLRRHESRSAKVNGTNVYNPGNDESCTRILSTKKLSTNDMIQSAAENFIQSFSQRIDNSSILNHPFASSFMGLLNEEARDVELIQCLLASAEKVGQKQFLRANQLLSLCEDLSSAYGSPVQRLVYYFSEALQERIDLETGRITSNSLGKKQMYHAEEAVIQADPSIIAFHQKVPFFQVSQFTEVQAIVENVAEARRVHLIYLDILNGIHATVIMQAFAARCTCPLEHLRLTAVTTTDKPKLEHVEKRIISFAQSMNLPFSFHVVSVPDLLSLRKDLFELDTQEKVAVYSPYALWILISKPNQLDCLMSVIRQINPCVMVVAEMEANHNSPIFVNRFTEALFYYGALFDSLEDCMDRSDPNRSIEESIYLGQGIRNTVAGEGRGRIMRLVKVNVWRAFFARFGMEEIKLSESNLYQAGLVLKEFACGSSCTLEKDGECLIIGWKGTSLFSVSAWKFS